MYFEAKREEDNPDYQRNVYFLVLIKKGGVYICKTRNHPEPSRTTRDNPEPIRNHPEPTRTPRKRPGTTQNPRN